MTDEKPTAKQEAEQLVDGVVETERSRIKDKHENLIQNIAEELNDFREMNVVFSETRRRLENE